jgi:hypothetical protein
MKINQYLKAYKEIRALEGGYEMRELTPHVECVDGFMMSVQASEIHYCTPRVNDADEYIEVEVGFPSAREELLMPFVEDEKKPTNTVYGYVPVSIVDKVIAKHGGFKKFKIKRR